tara:strand:- start:38869 stop:39300 length:432 start_codon:yes stop_codon:yes gene_type:complete
MKLKVFNKNIIANMKPPKNSVLIRTTSEDDFVPLVFRDCFLDVLELKFDDSSDNHPIEDLKHGVMTKEHYFQIKEFIEKHKNVLNLFVSCDAAQSRSPAMAIGIIDYLLEDPEQTKDLIMKNGHWKPNAFVMSFFRKDYYKQL